MIPSALREFAGGKAQVEIAGASGTVMEALAALCARYPGIRDRVMSEQGEVRPHINVFIGDENIRFIGGLAAAVNSESVITIVPAVSGGRRNGIRFDCQPAV